MLVIKNAQIFTASGHPETPEYFEKADLLIRDGKIAAIGQNLEQQENAEVIDASGYFVMPGLVDAHSHIGGFVEDDQDLNEMTQSATPAVEAFYGINSQSPDFIRATEAGITCSVVTPGSGNVVGGMACALKHRGNTIEDMCLANPVFLKMAMGGNPKGVYGPKNQLPMTRMGIAHVIREQLSKARDYLRKKEMAASGEGEKKDPPPYDEGMENLCKVLKRELPLKVHCEQYDMLTVIRIAKEFNILFTLDHAWGASDFYDEICGAENLVGVIFGPIGVLLLPGECGKTDIECLEVLDRRGVTCAIMTDGPIMAPEMLLGQAGEAVRAGTEHHRALRMITINAAKIARQNHRLGSLEPGKDADIAIFKGIPALDTTARCVMTLIDGEIMYREG